jgi:hypothetical protein
MFRCACLAFGYSKVNSFECVRGQGKTRGAIGFALIFLCFVSLYQDKEMKKKDNLFISAV